MPEADEKDKKPENPPAGDSDGDKSQADELAKVRKEAQKLRSQRNRALRRASAFETMLEAHNIDSSVATDQALAALDIEDGEVKDVFAYTAPKIKSKPSQSSEASESAESGGLTREKIEKMSVDEINKLWESGEMQGFLKSQRKK